MLLILQLFPAPQATSTRRGGGVRLRWTKSGWGQESAPFGQPQRKLEPVDIILSSYHAKKLAIYFISTARGHPQWTIISLPNLLLLFHMLMSMFQILARKHVHLQNLHSNLWNIHTTQERMPRNTCKILDNTVSCLVKL